MTSSVAAGHVVQQTRPEPVLKPTAHAGAKKAEEKRAVDRGVDLGWMDDGAGI